MNRPANRRDALRSMAMMSLLGLGNRATLAQSASQVTIPVRERMILVKKKGILSLPFPNPLQLYASRTNDSVYGNHSAGSLLYRGVYRISRYTVDGLAEFSIQYEFLERSGATHNEFPMMSGQWGVLKYESDGFQADPCPSTMFDQVFGDPATFLKGATVTPWEMIGNRVLRTEC